MNDGVDIGLMAGVLKWLAKHRGDHALPAEAINGIITHLRCVEAIYASVLEKEKEENSAQSAS